MSDILAPLTAAIARVEPVARLGRITAIQGGTLRVAGLGGLAAQGDRVQIGALGGEVLGLSAEGAAVLTDGAPDGLAIGDRVELCGAAGIAPDESWIGRIVDPYGNPLDGRPLMRGRIERPLRAEAPPAARRRRLGERLSTGVAVFDTLLPLVRGQRIGLFAGSGVGKSSLLAKFARGVQADIVVIALIGERGRELRDFTGRHGAGGRRHRNLGPVGADAAALRLGGDGGGRAFP